MTTQTYATQVTSYFLNAIAAAEAGGTMVNLAAGTLVVGDGNGSVPALSALIAANGVTHEVWRGSTINSVSVDPNNAAQLDVQVMIPATIGGVEIGPFTVTEFAILDNVGGCCIVGTTNLQKTTSSQGQVSDLVWIAAVVNGVGAVTVTPPSSSFLTLAQLVADWNANLPTAAEPVTQTDSTNSAGFIERVFGARLASQPADAVTVGAGSRDANAIGVGRPASAAEFAAFAPTSGGFSYPWPTLPQIGAKFGQYLPLAGGTLTGQLNITNGADLKLNNVSSIPAESAIVFQQNSVELFSLAVAPNSGDPYLNFWNSVLGTTALKIDGATNKMTAPGALDIEGSLTVSNGADFILDNVASMSWASAISFKQNSAEQFSLAVAPNSGAPYLNLWNGALGAQALRVDASTNTWTLGGQVVVPNGKNIVLDNSGSAPSASALVYEINGAQQFNLSVVPNSGAPYLGVWNAGLSALSFTIDKATNLMRVAGDPTDGLGVATKQYVDGSGSFSNPGWKKLPGGLIIQWGETSMGSADSVTVTLPISFPNGFLGGASSDTGGAGYSFGIAPISASQFTLFAPAWWVYAVGGTGELRDSTTIGRWLVIGY